MTKAWNDALAQAIRDVFENLCFMLPNHPELSVPPPSFSQLLLAVDFRGAGVGSLQLALPDRMVAPVAAAMLGADEELELSEQYDAVCELANIVCGNVLPLIAGERAVFDLSSPRVIATQDVDWEQGASARAQVLLDDGPVSAAIWLQLSESGAA
jgi:CheY-specific phosphatase CheX